MSVPYRIYMDDSGNVDPSTTNAPEHRYGSVTGVIFESKYLDDTFNINFPELVKKHFGTREDGSPHNLHRRVLASIPEHGPFSVLQDAEKKAAWDKAALKMFEAAQYTAISACVDKVGWYFRYPNWNGDFYQVLIEAVLERCFYFLSKRNGVAEVNIETKGNRDKRVKEQYSRIIKTDGLQFISADKLRTVFSSGDMNVLKKNECKPGIQLADLLAGPSLRHIKFVNVGRDEPSGEFTKQLCKILEEKKYYREGNKGPHGYGRVWRPTF
ncbi:DUF3800 domain-containing protein [Bradyrhizobium symbiodeficiens]|uniref:DUF3800 domain-containing protein n=1 Tax=Bradyrhizobium symbiodeficiens TaxID=1404367 RepID=UPI0030D50600